MLDNHSIVVVRNYGPKAHRAVWGGNPYIAPAAQIRKDGTLIPGQVSMPWEVARREFGDPFLVDVDPDDPYKRFRAQELMRLNTQFGLLDKPMYSEVPEFTGEARPDAVEPQPFVEPDDDGTIAGQYTPHPSYIGWFRHPNLPCVEVWTADSEPQRIYMVIDDPAGEDARNREESAVMRATVATDNARIADLEAQLHDLQATLASLNNLPMSVAGEGEGEIPADDDAMIAGGVSIADVRPEAPVAPPAPTEDHVPAATAPANQAPSKGVAKKVSRPGSR